MRRILSKIQDVSTSSGLLPATLFLALFFILGAVVGCISALHVDGDGLQDLVTFVRGFLSLAKSGLSGRSWVDIVVSVLKYPLLAVLFGLTALGVVLEPALLMARGFFLTFAVTSFVRLFGPKGILLALAVYLFQCVIVLPATFLLGAQGFLSAGTFLSLSMKRGGGTPERVFPPLYFGRVLLSAGALALCVLLEAFLTPPLVSYIVQFVW
ncbi:stage II sporulation protein M [Oscillospiraceae bacterium OttesenSCG-928-G22]|nr:stage II sporulation protein M [Oscillospiraceae bacterium OttesenSCG-928-G22]